MSSSFAVVTKVWKVWISKESLRNLIEAEALWISFLYRSHRKNQRLAKELDRDRKESLEHLVENR